MRATDYAVIAWLFIKTLARIGWKWAVVIKNWLLEFITGTRSRV